MRWSRADRHLVALAAVCSLAGCSSTQAGQRVDVPSREDAWVAAACTAAHPDFSTWTRHRVGGVTIAVPPGYIVEQGPMTNIYVRNDARRAHLSLTFLLQHEARQNYDLAFYRQVQKRNPCRSSLSGYQADAIGTYNLGQFSLIAVWEASWGGEDAGKWLMATISSTRVEEAIDLRAVLHTIRPVGTH
jgi:hypothetical protein